MTRRLSHHTACLLAALALAACSRTPSPAGAGASAGPSPRPVAEAPAAAQPSTAPTAGDGEPRTAGEVDFPAIPQIVVPEILGVGPAQRVLEDAMRGTIDPIAGVSVRPANCATGGALVDDAGITAVDAQGNFVRNGDDGIFKLNPDGSGVASFGGGIVTVNADGSGTINGSGGGGRDEGLVTVGADGSGAYNGRYGIISLDGKGAGTWNGDGGLIRNNGDGSGTWNGPQGLVTINADGSGTWNGPHGLVVNHGDGTGEIGPPPRKVKMAPLARVPPAGRFPPLKKFAPPGAPCGFVITLQDPVLFDFDKSDIRADVAKVLDVLAAALAKVDARSMEVRGHTDAKGTDAYNQALSERRAASVVEALRQRGAARQAGAKGYGESQPVAPNEIGGQDNPGGRQLNRRVEIFVRT